MEVPKRDRRDQGKHSLVIQGDTVNLKEAGTFVREASGGQRGGEGTW